MAKPTTPEGILSYPRLFDPKRNDLNGKDEYSCVLVFPPNTDISAMKALVEQAAERKFGKDRTKWPKGLRSPFRACSERAQEVDGKQVYPDGYVEGGIYVSFRSTNRPAVVNPDLSPCSDPVQAYAGRWARVSFSCYAYEKKGNKGVAFGLGNVQLLRDGKPIGGVYSTPEQDFVAVQLDAGTGAPTAPKTSNDLWS